MDALHAPVTVRSLSELRQLPSVREVNGLWTRRRVSVEIPELEANRRRAVEDVLNEYEMRCGCLGGGIATLAVVLAGGWWIAAGAGGSMTGLVGKAVAVFALATVSGGVVKIAALAVAKMQFSRAVHRLATELSARPVSREGEPSCGPAV